MLRRFLVNLIRRSFILLLVVCLGCVAQSASPDLARKIERQVRSYYKIPPEAHVLVGVPSPSADFPNYDSVVVTVDDGDKKQDLKFVVSKDGSSLVRTIKFDLTRDPFAELMSKIDVNGRPTRGAKASKVVVVNFDDFECPFCSRLHQTLFPQIFREYGDRVTFIYKDYPLAEIHPWAVHAAIDANCLAAQNTDSYWDFADFIHSNQNEVSNEKTPAGRFEQLDKITTEVGQRHNLDAAKLQACVKAQDDSAIRTSLKQGEAVGVDATPVLFVNGEQLGGGAVSVTVIRAALDRALKDNGMPVPEHATANSSATPPSK
jgi:protein-disulfide isomerase